MPRAASRGKSPDDSSGASGGTAASGGSSGSGSGSGRGGAKAGAKAVYLKGTCHKCSRNLREGTAVGACDSCGARFHKYDCGKKLAAAGITDRARAELCPRCSETCACTGGPVQCQASKQRRRRASNRKDKEKAAMGVSSAAQSGGRESEQAIPYLRAGGVMVTQDTNGESLQNATEAGAAAAAAAAFAAANGTARAAQGGQDDLFKMIHAKTTADIYAFLAEGGDASGAGGSGSASGPIAKAALEEYDTAQAAAQALAAAVTTTAGGAGHSSPVEQVTLTPSETRELRSASASGSDALFVGLQVGLQSSGILPDSGGDLFSQLVTPDGDVEGAFRMRKDSYDAIFGHLKRQRTSSADMAITNLALDLELASNEDPAFVPASALPTTKKQRSETTDTADMFVALSMDTDPISVDELMATGRTGSSFSTSMAYSSLASWLVDSGSDAESGEDAQTGDSRHGTVDKAPSRHSVAESQIFISDFSGDGERPIPLYSQRHAKHVLRTDAPLCSWAVLFPALLALAAMSALVALMARCVGCSQHGGGLATLGEGWAFAYTLLALQALLGWIPFALRIRRHRAGAQPCGVPQSGQFVCDAI